MTRAPNLLLAGCGKMGSALLKGWLDTIPDIAVTVIEPYEVPADSRIRHLSSFEDLEDDVAPTLCILAVKPQIMDDVCTSLKSKLIRGTPILSIAAGKTLSYFTSAFGPDTPVIRSMPNTPAAIGYGMTVACATPSVNATTKELATTLLHAVGLVEWINDESLMDAVTAVSGSGPAYVFLLMEELAKAGVAAGLPESLSLKLARQTVIGSAQLAASDPKTSASTLRQNVTSPNGTTAAALEVLMSDTGLAPLMIKAIDAATRRSRELAAS